jgi:hypothetical protein
MHMHNNNNNNMTTCTTLMSRPPDATPLGSCGGSIAERVSAAADGDHVVWCAALLSNGPLRQHVSNGERPLEALMHAALRQGGLHGHSLPAALKAVSACLASLPPTRAADAIEALCSQHALLLTIRSGLAAADASAASAPPTRESEDVMSGAHLHGERSERVRAVAAALRALTLVVRAGGSCRTKALALPLLKQPRALPALLTSTHEMRASPSVQARTHPTHRTASHRIAPHRTARIAPLPPTRGPYDPLVPRACCVLMCCCVRVCVRVCVRQAGGSSLLHALVLASGARSGAGASAAVDALASAMRAHAEHHVDVAREACEAVGMLVANKATLPVVAAHEQLATLLTRTLAAHGRNDFELARAACAALRLLCAGDGPDARRARSDFAKLGGDDFVRDALAAHGSSLRSVADSLLNLKSG